MKKIIKSQTGHSQVVWVMLVMVLLVAAFYYFMQKQYQPTTPSSNIQSDQQLMGVSNKLDSTNLDVLDKDLSQNDADATNF